MKIIFKNHFVPVSMLVFLLTATSCTKLDTKIGAPNEIREVTAGTPPSPSSLSKIYEKLNNFVNGQGKWFAMSEHPTDILMGPTRGTDWDDFGEWRELHLQTWRPLHVEVTNAWGDINSGLFETTLLAESATAPASDKAAARFLRAFFSYAGCDLFGQVQHRPATALAAEIPQVYTRSEACDFIISELEAIIPTLPTFTRALRDKATKEAAQFLLAKTYLNKAVFKQDPTKPAGNSPDNANSNTNFAFSAADMNKVIALCNSIAANTDLSLTNFYFDNFSWENGTKSRENIFVATNANGNNLVWLTCMGNHYFMTPDGWNGMVTLSNFYDSFDDADVRKGADMPGYTTEVGRPAGFLVGQQRGPSGKRIGNAIEDLKDRSGNPLIFTKDCPIVAAAEVKGIRNNKFPLDPNEMNGGGWGSKNDFPFFRLADVRLMKAEAILRGGTDAETPLAIVNGIRAKRGNPVLAPLASLDLKDLLAERGRELYLEGWRRNDLIRYGVFNTPKQERPLKTDYSRVVYPIPTLPLSSNPNLKQNFGY